MMEQHLAMGSRLQLSSPRHLIAFLRGSSRINKQLKAAPGRIDSKLRAQFPKLTFWTSSVWTDRAALDAFVRDEPHRSVMVELRRRGAMRSGDFAFWDVAPGSPAPGWDEVEARVVAAASAAAER
jgi:hypothetical protein